MIDMNRVLADAFRAAAEVFEQAAEQAAAGSEAGPVCAGVASESAAATAATKEPATVEPVKAEPPKPEAGKQPGASVPRQRQQRLPEVPEEVSRILSASAPVSDRCTAEQLAEFHRLGERLGIPPDLADSMACEKSKVDSIDQVTAAKVDAIIANMRQRLAKQTAA